MNQRSRSVLRYSGFLDSARTTHYLDVKQNDERWWLPDKESWSDQMVLAASDTLLRILRGDIICVPRNQFFDSPGWLNIASYLSQMKHPEFSICLLNLEPTLTNLLQDITNNMLRKPEFALSGWPGLSMDERYEIAKNIENNDRKPFSNMFKNVRIDSSLKTIFEEQRNALQTMYEYIGKSRLEQ